MLLLFLIIKNRLFKKHHWAIHYRRMCTTGLYFIINLFLIFTTILTKSLINLFQFVFLQRYFWSWIINLLLFRGIFFLNLFLFFHLLVYFSPYNHFLRLECLLCFSITKFFLFILTYIFFLAFFWSWENFSFFQWFFLNIWNFIN